MSEVVVVVGAPSSQPQAKSELTALVDEPELVVPSTLVFDVLVVSLPVQVIEPPGAEPHDEGVAVAD